MNNNICFTMSFRVNRTIGEYDLIDVSNPIVCW